ncbi:MAG: MerR family transcriptional regulator [Phycisphaerae bacterium]
MDSGMSKKPENSAGRQKPPEHHSDAKDLMRLGEASRTSGVSKQAIEYYIMLGLIDPIRGEDGRSRWFNRRLVRRIKLIRKLNRTGYTLRDIREIFLRRKR